MAGRRIAAIAAAVVVVVAGAVVGAALLLGSDGPGEDCGVAVGGDQGDDPCLPPAASPMTSPAPSSVSSPDPVAAADLVAAVDAALAGSGLGWSGDEVLALVPHCSPVDAVLGYALTASLEHPEEWSPPARDDWVLVETGGPISGSGVDPITERTWRVDRRVEVNVTGGTARVTVELADAETERLRKHPRVGEPEFVCG